MLHEKFTTIIIIQQQRISHRFLAIHNGSDVYVA